MRHLQPGNVHACSKGVKSIFITSRESQINITCVMVVSANQPLQLLRCCLWWIFTPVWMPEWNALPSTLVRSGGSASLETFWQRTAAFARVPSCGEALRRQENTSSRQVRKRPVGKTSPLPGSMRRNQLLSPWFFSFMVVL